MAGRKRLTQQEVIDRCEAYEQAAQSLEGHWFDDDGEYRQGLIVARQIRAMADRFYVKYSEKKGKP